MTSPLISSHYIQAYLKQAAFSSLKKVKNVQVPSCLHTAQISVKWGNLPCVLSSISTCAAQYTCQ